MCVHWPPRPNDLGGRGFDLKIKLSDPDYLCSRGILGAALAKCHQNMYHFLLQSSESAGVSH